MTQQHTPPLPPFIIFALLLARASADHSSCYTGDGAEDTSPQPCPGSNMCCYLNRTDGYADDVCIQGACYSNYWTGQYFVIGCTNNNWDEEGSGCSPLWDVCGRQSGYTHVTRCNDGSFCCGDSNTACCNSYSGVYLNEDGTEILQSSESGMLPDTTTSSTDVPYSSPIPTSLQTRVLTSTGTSTTNLPSQIATATNVPSADKSEEGLSTEAKIGIGVGVPAVVLAALTLWRQCRQKGP